MTPSGAAVTPLVARLADWSEELGETTRENVEQPTRLSKRGRTLRPNVRLTDQVEEIDD